MKYALMRYAVWSLYVASCTITGVTVLSVMAPMRLPPVPMVPPIFSRINGPMAVQAPDPSHEGHKMRPDGQSCKTSGPDACQCSVSSCERDAQGKVTSWHASSQCQWYCKVEKCTCHACLEGDCPSGDGSIH